MHYPQYFFLVSPSLIWLVTAHSSLSLITSFGRLIWYFLSIRMWLLFLVLLSENHSLDIVYILFYYYLHFVVIYVTFVPYFWVSRIYADFFFTLMNRWNDLEWVDFGNCFHPFRILLITWNDWKLLCNEFLNFYSDTPASWNIPSLLVSDTKRPSSGGRYE